MLEISIELFAHHFLCTFTCLLFLLELSINNHIVSLLSKLLNHWKLFFNQNSIYFFELLFFFVMFHCIKTCFHNSCIDFLSKVQSGKIWAHYKLLVPKVILPWFKTMEHYIMSLTLWFSCLIPEVIEQNCHVLLLGKVRAQ